MVHYSRIDLDRAGLTGERGTFVSIYLSCLGEGWGAQSHTLETTNIKQDLYRKDVSHSGRNAELETFQNSPGGFLHGCTHAKQMAWVLL